MADSDTTVSSSGTPPKPQNFSAKKPNLPKIIDQHSVKNETVHIVVFGTETETEIQSASDKDTA